MYTAPPCIGLGRGAVLCGIVFVIAVVPSTDGHGSRGTVGRGAVGRGAVSRGAVGQGLVVARSCCWTFCFSSWLLDRRAVKC